MKKDPGNGSMRNPYISLMKTAWLYARHERKKFALVYTMFMCSNIINAMGPILFGWFIGKIQEDNKNVLYYAMLFAGGYLAINLGLWSLHGPARVMERTLAFTLSRNFLQERYHQALHLPAKWH